MLEDLISNRLTVHDKKIANIIFYKKKHHEAT